jgi:hypothetical protein
MAHTIDRKADATGKFQVPGAFGFSIEPDPVAAAPAAGWALSISRNEAGEIPLVVTSPRAHFQPRRFDRLEVSNAPVDSRWLVTLFDEGEFVALSGGSSSAPPTAAEIAAAIVAAQLSTVLLLDKTLTDANLVSAIDAITIGSDGTVSNIESVPPAFDARPYRWITVSMFAAGLVGGTAPTLSLRMDFVTAAVAMEGLNSFQVTPAGVPLSGQLAAGDGLGFGAAPTGRALAICSLRPEFFKLNLYASGNPTGWSPANGGRLLVYGRRG